MFSRISRCRSIAWRDKSELVKGINDMNISDPIADMLTRIRNAGNVMHPEVSMPSSRLKNAIAKVLKKEGYIKGFKIEDEGSNKKCIRISLKYLNDTHVIEGLKRVSLPSLRVYVSATEIPRVLGGLGVAIMSTANGVMNGKQAKKENLGGEVLCYVW